MQPSEKELEKDYQYYKDLIWKREYEILEDYFKFSLGIIGASWAIISSKFFINTSILFYLTFFTSIMIIFISFLRKNWDAQHLRVRYEEGTELNQFVDVNVKSCNSCKMDFWGVVAKYLLLITFLLFLIAPIHSYLNGGTNHINIEDIKNLQQEAPKHP